jgi:hypothetical protein
LEKTGVPSVDYGTLMYYNMGNISLEIGNSIYEQKTALRYLPSLSAYPLKLNVALPIYSWGVHIRNHKVIGLLNKMSEDDLLSDNRFHENDNGAFEVIRSDFVGGRYLETKDVIKIESITPHDIQQMVSDLHKFSSKNINEFIFFDLDSINLKHYEKDLFNKTVAAD